MYCSSCGGQIGEGLNFCSRCGKRVQELRAATPSAADNLIGALGYVGGGGFLGFFIMLAVLLKKGIPPEFLTLMAALYLATLFGICFLILRQGNMLSGKTKRSEAAPADGYSPPSLRPATTAHSMSPAIMASVQ